MKTIVLTGGIASGKSTACRWLSHRLKNLWIFDCDVEAKKLTEQDPEVRNELIQTFGEQVIDEQGRVSRGFLRERVFQNEAERLKLEAIIHPRLRQLYTSQKSIALTENAAYFLVDVPLFFEKGFDFEQDLVVLIASKRETQVQRLIARDEHSAEMIEAIINAQLPVEEKMDRADVVIWNEGYPSVLKAQLRRFILDLQQDPASPSAFSPLTEDVKHFRRHTFFELQELANALKIRGISGATKNQLIYEILVHYSREGTSLVGEGIVEKSKNGTGMLRSEQFSFKESIDDIFVPAELMKQHQLKIGHKVKARIKAPRERGKSLMTFEILEIEGVPVAQYQARKDFDLLTPLFPDERIHLEANQDEGVGVRVIDLVAPLGKGQRGIIIAPPRGGKTILLKQIARSIQNNHPEAILIILLLDERPEEVTDFEETIHPGAFVFASTFDETPQRHAQVADMVLERSKRLVEEGKHVILLLDSLTRLARGHNAAMQNGPIGSGGVNGNALQKSRKFFGTARNVEEGGSLTILATALVETESRMDDVIFEEFKGTGNMEVRLDRELAEKRIFPAIHLPQSGTRNDDRLYHPDEFKRVLDLRRQLAQLPVGDALVTLLSQLKQTKSNTEFLLRGLR